MSFTESRIDGLVEKYLPEVLELRRQLHMYPELSTKEFDTTQTINSRLDQYGIRKLPIAAETGAAGEVSGTGGPLIVIRADIDALPIEEESGLPFRSRVPGVSHMCGHDVHTSIALGAAAVINELKEELPGSVRVIFQPAEEFEGGAESMIEEGLLENAEAIIGLHNVPELPAGTIGIKDGFLMGSIDDFTITIKGKGGHAGIPEQTIDPIVIGSAVVSQLQTLVSRMVPTKEAAVVSIGSFHAGHTNNVIPDKAVLKGTVRTSNDRVRYQIKDAFIRLVSHVAEGMGAAAEIDYELVLPPVVNDSRVAAIVKEAAIRTVGESCVVEAESTMGGEDFSLYLQKVPGCYAWLGSGNKEKGIIYGWHHPKFMVDESAIEIGIKWMVQSVFLLMERIEELKG